MRRAADADCEIARDYVFYHRTRDQGRRAGGAEGAGAYYGYRPLFRGPAGGKFQTSARGEKSFRFGAGGRRVRDDRNGNKKRFGLFGVIFVRKQRHGGGFGRHAVGERQPMYDGGNSDFDFQNLVRSAAAHDAGHRL